MKHPFENIEGFDKFLKQAEDIVAKHKAEYKGEYHMKGGILGKVLPVAGAVVGNLIAPGIGGAIGGALGGAASGGGIKGALAGGLGGGLSGGWGSSLGSGLSNALGLELGAPATAGLGGSLLGGATGALSGGGVKGALLGAGLGGAGAYLNNGGASQLLGGTQLGNSLGLSNPQGGSLIGNALGGSTSGKTLGEAMGLTGSGSLFGGSPTGLSPADLKSANSAAMSAQGFSPQEANFLSNAKSVLTPANQLSTLTGSGAGLSSGGGMSSFSGTGLLGNLLGGANSANAVKKAKQAQIDAQNAAMAQLQPYQATGNAANSALADALGLSGNTSAANYGQLAKPFNINDFQVDPGYQFALEQGQLGRDRANAARGGYYSGAALKEASDWAQNMANQQYQSAYDRYTQQNENLYNKLAGQQGVGYNASQGIGDIYGNIGNIKSNAASTTADLLGSNLASILGGRYTAINPTRNNSNSFLASLGLV